MDVNYLREVINATAKLEAKEITLPILQNCLKATGNSILMPQEDMLDILWKISYQYCLILTKFVDEGLMEKEIDAPVHNQVINQQVQTNFLAAVDLVRQFTLHLYLPRELRGLSKNEAQLRVMVEEQERVRRLSYCVVQFRCLFQKKFLALHPSMGDCVIDFISGCYSLTVDSIVTDIASTALTKEIILRCLLMIKGTKHLSFDLYNVLHKDLLQLTGESDGFSILCRTLLAIGGTAVNTPAWHKSQVIAKIVTTKGHTKKFYRQVLTNCLEFYHWAIYADIEEAPTYANTCVECLKQFFQLPQAYAELHERIETYFFGRFQKLTSPVELIAGYVVMEQAQLGADLYECHMGFTGSTITSLPSFLLVPYLSLFVMLLTILPSTCEEVKYIQNMVIFCLANRPKEELQQILLSLAMDDTADGISKPILHPRIIMKPTTVGENYILQIGPIGDESSETRNLLPTLVKTLKSTNRNLLMYDVFVNLLSVLMTSTRVNISPMKNFLMNESEKKDVIYKRFYQQCLLIQSLGDLCNHKNFCNQLYDNPDEVLHVLEAALTQAIVKPVIKNEVYNISADILDVVLSILQEFLQRIRDREKVEKTIKLLQRYRSSTGCTDQTKEKIDFICNTSSNYHDGVSDSICQNAISLCADKEPYCKVYGTTLLLKLLKDRDIETVSQRHIILVLAFENLRNAESYAFLNSVRLIVALSDVMESETVDALVKEYLNEDNEIDYRLKIGEATVKTVESLGPFAVRYRDALLNCFLSGTHSSLNEFRTSSLSNVGSICRILSYQVHHFFYELFMCISTMMETEEYLPSRRAGILVLSQLIEGMEDLIDFQEYLLPIYRFLKLTIRTDKDDVTRLQAAVALDHLKAKTKKALEINPVDLERRMFGQIM